MIIVKYNLPKKSRISAGLFRLKEPLFLLSAPKLFVFLLPLKKNK